MPIFEYLGPFDAVEVDEAVVHAGETVEVTDERADTFRHNPSSWGEVKKHKPKKPRPAAEDTTENTEES